MYEVELLNLETKVIFTKVFWDKQLKNKFIRKCKYSKKLKVLGVSDYSRLYD